MSEQVKESNAKITETMLGVEDHGIFTAYITVEGSWGGQAFWRGIHIRPIPAGFSAEDAILTAWRRKHHRAHVPLAVRDALLKSFR